MYFSPPLPLPAATGVLYIPKIEEKEDEEPKRIVPKNDNKQKSLFEF